MSVLELLRPSTPTDTICFHHASMRALSKQKLNFVLKMISAAKTLGNMLLHIFLNKCKLSYLSDPLETAESSMDHSDLMDYSGSPAMSTSATAEEKVLFTTTFPACFSPTSWDAGALVMMPSTDLLAHPTAESVAVTP